MTLQREPYREEGEVPASQPGPLVLVVDDDPDGRELAVDILTVAGMRVAEATDGPSAPVPSAAHQCTTAL